MRGFKDNIPPLSYAIEHVRLIFEKHCKKFGCDMVDLPLVEESDLYFRTSGDASDVCNKELFEVRKWKGEFQQWVLRPEGTASCMRAIKEASLMQAHRQVRLSYFAPMFRYNRPQKGRYRQFLQAGWEFVGQKGAASDCEVILGAVEFIKQFGFDFVVEINSIGSAEDRRIYRSELREKLNLDEDTDPLKILDKADNFDSIPQMKLSQVDSAEFQTLCDLLTKNGVKFKHNPYLVRGLDYYNSVVFEIKACESGQTVLAGGRYDGLMEQIGGQATSAIGFAAGVDRIIEHMNYQHENHKIALIALDNAEYALLLAKKIREEYENGCVVYWNLDLSKALRECDKQNYEWVIICGENEAANNEYILKNLRLKTEERRKFTDVLNM